MEIIPYKQINYHHKTNKYISHLKIYNKTINLCITTNKELFIL
jgi:hypothetical protein